MHRHCLSTWWNKSASTKPNTTKTGRRAVASSLDGQRTLYVTIWTPSLRPATGVTSSKLCCSNLSRAPVICHAQQTVHQLCCSVGSLDERQRRDGRGALKTAARGTSSDAAVWQRPQRAAVPRHAAASPPLVPPDRQSLRLRRSAPARARIAWQTPPTL